MKYDYVREVMVLPFGGYGLLSGSINHKEQYYMLKNDILKYQYLNSQGDDISKDLKAVVGQAKYIHFLCISNWETLAIWNKGVS